MKHRLFVFTSIVFVLLFSSPHGVRGQTPLDPEPIFLWVRGDLWQIDPLDLSAPPVQVTTDGTLSSPTISPNALSIAYKAAAAVGLEALDRVQVEGEIADFDLPADLFVLDTGSGMSQLIAGQPDGASLFVDGVPDRAVIRSAPAWSPEASALAWTEIAFGSGSADLVILDGRTGNGVRLGTELPVGGIPPRVVWGNGGILVWLTGENAETWVGFYDAGGDLLWRHLLPPQEHAVEEAVWLEDGDRSLPALLYSDGEWVVFDPLTEPPQPLEAVPSLLALRNPGESFQLSFGVLPDTGFFWEAIDPLQPDAASVAFPGSPGRVTLSPSGRAIAFLGFPEFGAAAIYRDGEVFEIPNTGSDTDELNVGAILWGAGVWQAGR